MHRGFDPNVLALAASEAEGTGVTVFMPRHGYAPWFIFSVLLVIGMVLVFGRIGDADRAFVNRARFHGLRPADRSFDTDENFGQRAKLGRQHHPSESVFTRSIGYF
jgi:hypothetical protein